MTTTRVPVWRCGHLCLIDAPESYRALRMCPECRVAPILFRSERQARFVSRLLYVSRLRRYERFERGV